MTKQDKVAKVMHEWKNGRLFSNGKKVTDYDQAIAIALSEAGLSKYAEGGGVGNDNFYVKSNFGNFSVTDRKNNKMVVGYSKKEDAIITAKGLNDIDNSQELNETIIKLKTMKGYGHFLNQYAEGENKIKGEELMERGGEITEKGWKNINDTLWEKGEIMVIDESKFGGEKVFSVENNLTQDVREFEDKKEAYKYAIEKSSMPSGTKLLYLYKLGYKKEAYEIRKASENSENSTFESFKRVMDKVVDSKNEIYSRNKFAVGGEIGNTVSFKGDYGTPRSGVVKEKIGSSYIVSTDDGDRLVDSYEVISFSETPIAKKKRFGFFAEGGSIESKKQAILDFINSFPDKPKDWSEATDDLPELHHDIADEYGSKYDFDFNKRSSLRDRNLRHKQHAKSLLNKLSDEEIDKIYSKWEETLEDKFEGGGEIQSKIDKLQAVVNSKMMPESVKEKARKQIAELEKELHESRKDKGEWTTEALESELNYYKNLLRNIDKPLYKDYNKKKVEQIISELEDKLHESKETKAEEKDKYVVWEYETYKIISKHPTLAGAEKYAKELVSKNKSKLYSFGSIEKYERFKAEDKAKEETKAEEKEEHKEGGSEYKSKIEKDLEKELHRLQKDLFSDRLLKFREGDDSEEAKEREKERQSKLNRFTEIIELLNKGYESPNKEENPIYQELYAKAKEENKMTGESEGERNVGMDKPEDYIEAKVKNLEASLKDKTISETQRKRDEKELALFKKAKAPTTRKAPIKKAVAKKVVAKKEIEAPAKPKADHKKLVAKLKAKKGATPSNEPSKGHKRSESSDRKRDALPLGKRVSADGNTYWENRLNRGDLNKGDKFAEGGEVKGSDWGLNLNW